MEYQLKQIEQSFLSQSKGQIEEIALFSGIKLLFYQTAANKMSIHHSPSKHLLELNYCLDGRISWQIENGTYIYLGPGDFSIHTLDICTHSKIDFPTGYYKGLSLCVDLTVTSESPPSMLTEAGFSLQNLVNKFCKNNTFSSFYGNTKISNIFNDFYQKNDSIGLSLQKIKCLELLLYLQQMSIDKSMQLTEYESELVEIVHKVHANLLQNMQQRYTIEELARQYAVNSTTLKAVFKAVYGNSLAAHMKEHRINYAAKLLRETNDSIALISQEAGYESPSRFANAFKSIFHMLPSEYRKVILRIR